MADRSFAGGGQCHGWPQIPAHAAWQGRCILFRVSGTTGKGMAPQRGPCQRAGQVYQARESASGKREARG